MSTPDTAASPAITRRRALALGGLGLVTLGAASCSTDDGASSATTPSDPTSTGAPSTSATPGGPPTTRSTPLDVAPLVPADFEALPTCLLLPELTPGPFPTLQQLERRDLAEGHPGHPLRLGLRVVDASCAPVAGAAVEVWHTDATGDYSAYVDGGGGKDEAEGTTFCRGFQRADDDGIVELQTIYPGWYPGRAVHVHVRVRIGEELALTTQLFFPDELTAEVVAEVPYADEGQPDTTNATDGFGGDIATNGTLVTATAALTTTGKGTLALANLGIDR